jgi:hypothetical protein
MKAIITKYHGPTATKPAYIKAKDMDGNSYKIPVSYLLHSDRQRHLAVAKGLMDKMGLNYNLIGGQIKTGFVWVMTLPVFELVVNDEVLQCSEQISPLQAWAVFAGHSDYSITLNGKVVYSQEIEQ